MGEELANQERDALTGGGGLYRGGDGGIKKASGASGFLNKGGPVIAIFLVLVVLPIILVSIVPSILIGTLKENLLNALGFKSTVAVLEKQAEYVVSEELANGKMPTGLYEDFLAQGIEVGQVTLAGEFVPTSTYIADIDGEVAANGEYESHGSGELSIRFKGEVIQAADFVAKVESDPVLYAAYSDAADISARFYYSDTVNEFYKKAGLNRKAFSAWQATGDDEKDKESFNKILEKLLDSRMIVNTASKYKDIVEVECQEGDENCGQCQWEDEDVEWDQDTYGNGVSMGDANGLIRNTAKNSRANGETPAENNAAQLLSATLSSSEPYLAANAFLAVVEAIEQVQSGDNGPVNYVMNLLSTPNEVTYTDVETGESVTTKKSILESTNFVAAVSESDYSKEEARNFERDRVLVATGLSDDDAIKNTVVSSDGGKKSGLGIVMNNGIDAACRACRQRCTCGEKCDCSESCGGADVNKLSVATDSLNIGLAEKNSELFPTVVGANRIVEGGSFLSNSINQYALGAMPSDSKTVLSYQKEVEEIIARQKAAERATKNPFDISSPNTFMGSLVRKIAMASLPGFSKSGSVVASLGSSVLGLARDAFSGLFGSTMADGNGAEFETMDGEYCITVGITGASCDLYGNAHTTVSTSYMQNTMKDWQDDNDIKGWLEDGQIGDGRGNKLAEFVMYGMGRTTTVGVRNYEVCTGYKERSFNFFQRLWDSITNGAANLENQCNGVSSDVANGTAYAFSDKNANKAAIEKYSAFVLYDTVSSLLEGEVSRVSVFRSRYLENDLDDDVLASEQ